METIRYLLGKIVKIVIGIFLIVFLVSIVKLFFPNPNASDLLDFSIFKEDWLPPPRQYNREGVHPDENGVYGTVYQPSTPFNGYQTQSSNPYIGYSYNGQMPTTTQDHPFPGGGGTPSPDRMQYLRNLSVYDGGNIGYGQTIYGDAKGTMFRNGIFQIVITDSTGRPLASMYAMNTGTWSVPGWPRWKATVPVRLPPNMACMLVFLSADGARITVPVRCN